MALHLTRCGAFVVHTADVFTSGQYVVVFRSRLTSAAPTGYATTAQEMEGLVQAQPGYVEHKAFSADDGERVTIATFADAASVEAWGQVAAHREAQRRGRQEFYSTYALQVARVERVSAFP